VRGTRAAEEHAAASAGDLVVIHAHDVGEHERLGEILEVLGEDTHVHFRVRWDDGRTSLFYPGSDDTIRRAARRGKPKTNTRPRRIPRAVAAPGQRKPAGRV
jgi:hypothetical protein